MSTGFFTGLKTAGTVVGLAGVNGLAAKLNVGTGFGTGLETGLNDC